MAWGRKKQTTSPSGAVVSDEIRDFLDPLIDDLGISRNDPKRPAIFGQFAALLDTYYSNRMLEAVPEERRPQFIQEMNQAQATGGDVAQVMERYIPNTATFLHQALAQFRTDAITGVLNTK